MIKTLIDLMEYLRVNAPLLTSLAILTILCVLLAKSIKKHSTVYYTVLAIPFILVSLPSLARLFGIEMAGFVRVPVLGEIVRDYIHMGTFGHPILIIIMYMGALNAKNKGVKRLLSIRKELSIIVGFPVLAHSLIRVLNNLPGALLFFGDREEYLSTTNVVSETGAGITSFSFILGIFMILLFIPLWVTSFDWVRKHMKYQKWKSIQKWAYVLYATLFIHAMTIQVGGMLNPRGGHAQRPAVEVSAAKTQGDRGATAKPATGGRTPSKSLSDFNADAQTKRYIHIVSLILIYGSYLHLRLRKAKRNGGKRKTPSLA